MKKTKIKIIVVVVLALALGYYLIASPIIACLTFDSLMENTTNYLIYASAEKEIVRLEKNTCIVQQRGGWRPAYFIVHKINSTNATTFVAIEVSRDGVDRLMRKLTVNKSNATMDEFVATHYAGSFAFPFNTPENLTEKFTMDDDNYAFAVKLANKANASLRLLLAKNAELVKAKMMLRSTDWKAEHEVEEAQKLAKKLKKDFEENQKLRQRNAEVRIELLNATGK